MARLWAEPLLGIKRGLDTATYANVLIQLKEIQHKPDNQMPHSITAYTTGEPRYNEPGYSENPAILKEMAGLLLYTGKVPWL